MSSCTLSRACSAVISLNDSGAPSGKFKKLESAGVLEPELGGIISNDDPFEIRLLLLLPGDFLPLPMLAYRLGGWNDILVYFISFAICRLTNTLKAKKNLIENT